MVVLEALLREAPGALVLAASPERTARKREELDQVFRLVEGTGSTQLRQWTGV